MNNKRKPLAGFLIASDVDRTIVDTDTIFDFFEKFGRRKVAEELDGKAESSDIEVVLNDIVAEQLKNGKKGLSEEVFMEVADRAPLFLGASDFFLRMKALGASICLLTASYEPIAICIAERLGLKNADVLATSLQSKNGFIVGCRGSAMDGQRKAEALLDICKKKDVLLSNVVGLADSPSDIPFMDEIRKSSGLCIWVSGKKPDFSSMKNTVMEWIECRYHG